MVETKDERPANDGRFEKSLRGVLLLCPSLFGQSECPEAIASFGVSTTYLTPDQLAELCVRLDNSRPQSANVTSLTFPKQSISWSPPVTEHHLHRYLAEFDFRYSHRIAMGIDDATRSVVALMAVKGKRLTYRRPT